jgi:hypothetical protein
MLPRELIEHCGQHCKTIEAATLVLIESFFEIHNNLLLHLEEMLRVQNQLMEAAHYQPMKLVDYIDTLMRNERSTTTIEQLKIAKRQLVEQNELNCGKAAADLNANILQDLREELRRRVNLTAAEAGAEEANGSTFFNDVLSRKVPEQIRSQEGCPKPLENRVTGIIPFREVKPPKYSTNLKQMIKLVKHLLTSAAVFRNHEA